VTCGSTFPVTTKIAENNPSAVGETRVCHTSSGADVSRIK
jgi:hypothetical protein